MAVILDASGTQTATIGTEHTLDDTAAAATYQIVVDTVNMAAGDVLELRVYDMVDGTNRRVVYFQQYRGNQPTDDEAKVSVPVSTDLATSGAIRFTLKQTAGTGRAYPWKVRKFA